MSTDQFIGLMNQFSHDYCQSRPYPSHHSHSLDMGTPVPWGTGSYGKQQSQQQRLPPTPPMHTHLGDYHYGSIEADYRGNELSIAPVQHTPLSPPVSEGFMSPDLTIQDTHQAWSHPYGIDSSPLLGMNAYTSNMGAMQEAQPITGGKKKIMGGLFPDVSVGQSHRKKRRLTEPSEANYHCQICGKYFSRVWNYNAHRETHDPSRPKPHICTQPNCEKAFVRRTDLTRHVQCVHAKDKKYRCSMCNNRFARKDTLRRHEDDGCPKRIDIQSRTGKGINSIGWTSLALQCPPPQEYFTCTYPKPQNQQYQMFDNSASASFLPPLSVALNGSQTQ
ncbi:hypothetical protein BGX38DRAFT_123711 [Terfezia claveryi]|nr:hypothetical protein BGX38DRAFT_123711 [Terfezia claveryi]